MGAVGLEKPAGETSTVYSCTGLERLLTFLHDGFDGLGMGALAARFEGTLDVDRLREALATMQRRHPKLRAALHADASGRPVFHVVDDAPPISLEVRTAAGPHDWTTGAVHLMDPFPPHSMPLVRLLLVEDAERRHSELIGAMHHAVIDGVSMGAFIHELMRFYVRPESTPGCAPDEFGIEPTGPRGYVKRLGVLRRVIGMGVDRALADLVHRPPNLPDEGDSPGSLRRLVLGEAETAALVRRCRAERTTMTGALGAATVATLSRHYGWEQRRVACLVPINVRPYMHPPVAPEVMAPLASGTRVLAARADEGDFWQRARGFRDQLTKSIEGTNPLEPLAVLSWVSVRPRRQRGAAAVAVVNNLGRMESVMVEGAPRLLEFSAFGKQRSEKGPMTVLACTVADRLNLTLRAERLPAATVETLGASLVATLHEAASA